MKFEIPVLCDYTEPMDEKIMECSSCGKSTCREKTYYAMVRSFSEFKDDEITGAVTSRVCTCGFFSFTHEPI